MEQSKRKEEKEKAAARHPWLKGSETGARAIRRTVRVARLPAPRGRQKNRSPKSAMMKVSNKPSKTERNPMARYYSIHHVTGTHLTSKDREMIQTVYNNNLRLTLKDRQSLRSMAKSLGLPVSTLHREIRRGVVSTPNTFRDKDIWDYSDAKAQNGVDAGDMNRGCAMKMTAEIAVLLRKLILEQGCSPFDARCKLVDMGLPWVSSESSIYNHIEHGDIGIYHGQTPYHP